MPIQAYSLCSCGTGKKIKFCCPELLGDLDKLEKMLEGEQFLASLKHIEKLEEKHPHRGSLLVLKSHILRHLGRLDEALSSASTFVEHYPESPIAYADMAQTLAASGSAISAMDTLQTALELTSQQMYVQVYWAIGEVADALLAESCFRAARALWEFQANIHPDNQTPREAIYRMNSHSAIPLLLRSDRQLVEAPADAAWKEKMQKALAPCAQGQWRLAHRQLETLTEEVGDEPVLWTNLVLLRGWLADTSGCHDALEKLASLDIPLEDAVEAQALAYFDTDHPLQDGYDLVTLGYTITDVEKVLSELASNSHAAPVPVEPSMAGEDGVPPMASYMFLDRETPKSAEGMSLKDISRVQCSLVVFGRQTDREARLEVFAVSARNLETVKERVGQIVSSVQTGEITEKVITQVSACQELMDRPWRLPQDITPDQWEALTQEHFTSVVYEKLPQVKLGILDGRSLEEAASEESDRVKVLAAIMILEDWSESMDAVLDFNQLRSQLGLPVLEAIDPEHVDLGRLSLTRLHRLTVEKISDADLEMLMIRTTAYRAAKAICKIGAELIARPNFVHSDQYRFVLDILARVEKDDTRALDYIERGHKAAEAAGESDAAWDLLEFPMRVKRREPEEVTRLLQHLQENHMKEPGVAEALTQFLVQLGAIRPDGSLAAPEPSGAVADSNEPEQGKIWTPDDENPAGEKSKLWTPGMD